MKGRQQRSEKVRRERKQRAAFVVDCRDIDLSMESTNVLGVLPTKHLVHVGVIEVWWHRVLRQSVLCGTHAKHSPRLRQARGLSVIR